MEKIGSAAKKAGVKCIYAALLLYYALLDDEVPISDRILVIGALGYLILPFDFIPDFMGPLGFSDDTTALVMAVKAIWGNITPNVKRNARERLQSIFGSIDASELNFD